MSAERELSFVVEPSEEYHCPICAKVLVEPHVTDCCGQHFCEECLKQWFEEQLGEKICPHCRSEEFTHIRYLPLKRKINELPVYCSNRENGCTELLVCASLNPTSTNAPTRQSNVRTIVGILCFVRILRIILTTSV